MTTPQTYECANCSGVFEKAWSDEEARTEYETNFPTTSQIPDDAVTVCDDCYHAMIEWKSPVQYEAEL